MIDALIDSPEIIQQIIDALMGDAAHLEHYWGMSIEDGTTKIHYEYYGKVDHVPNKFMHKKLIPLHSHTGVTIPKSLMSQIKYELSKWARDELNPKSGKLHGSSHPSWHDIIGFILEGYTTFGVCALLNGHVRISFYDPTILEENDLRCILDTVIDNDTKINLLAEEKDDLDGEELLQKVIALVIEQLEMWQEVDCLKKFDREPYSAHLIVPL